MLQSDTHDIYLTKDGLEELKSELDELKNTKRPDAITRLAAAREKGDLSENAEYTTAKEEVDMLDGRIEELEEIIARAKTIRNVKSGGKKIRLGSKITVTIKGKPHVFTLVGEWEADPKEKKISHDSPLGKALIGKKEGAEVEVDAPAGKIMYKISKIH
jgi:transcription elongation factor GreA